MASPHSFECVCSYRVQLDVSGDGLTNPAPEHRIASQFGR